MMDFVKNWLHFVKKAGLGPTLVGAADAALLSFCNEHDVAAAGIIPELDVWTYRRKPKSGDVYEMKAKWKYFRHHDSDFLEMGLVKVRGPPRNRWGASRCVAADSRARVGVA